MGRKKRIEKRVGKPTDVGSILEAFLQEKGYAAQFKEWEVVSNWGLVAGEQIARVTECDRVENGVLYVKVKSAAWRQELSYLISELKESVREKTGCKTIKNIVLQ